MNSGDAPTARNARTGLLTPPGMILDAAQKQPLTGGCFHIVRIDTGAAKHGTTKTTKVSKLRKPYCDEALRDLRG